MLSITQNSHVSMVHARLVDVAWAAGLIEGEGCFTIHSKKHPYLLVDMCDKDVIDKLHKIFPCGTVRGPYHNKNKPNHKPRWRFDAFGPKCRNIVLEVYPYMCARRRARIDELMELK